MNAITKAEPKEVVRPADPMISMIERVAMDPNVPIERLERMMDLKERHDEGLRRDREERARMEYFAAMSAAQSEMPTVVRSKENKHTKSRYADMSDIREQALPIAHRHGFAISTNPCGTENGSLIVEWTVMHSGGHAMSGRVAFPLDAAGSQGNSNKTAIQAMGSTMTYAERYIICKQFNIATDDDSDGNQPRQSSATITADQFFELRDLIEKAGTPEETVLRAYGLGSLEETPAKTFDSMCKRLNATIRNKAAQ